MYISELYLQLTNIECLKMKQNTHFCSAAFQV